MAGLLLWCEMTIIKTIAPHLENILMQNTAQDSQETSFETALNSNRVLCLCPALVDASHQKAVNSRGRVSGTVSIRETKGAASMGKKEKTAWSLTCASPRASVHLGDGSRCLLTAGVQRWTGSFSRTASGMAEGYSRTSQVQRDQLGPVGIQTEFNVRIQAQHETPERETTL